ncbi:MAG: hypothetical protein L0K86_29690, partial [Actinomycetia bacterium]|nr:hypothetical protein [Actinomycetes bacterium]
MAQAPRGARAVGARGVPVLPLWRAALARGGWAAGRLPGRRGTGRAARGPEFPPVGPGRLTPAPDAARTRRGTAVLACAALAAVTVVAGSGPAAEGVWPESPPSLPYATIVAGAQWRATTPPTIAAGLPGAAAAAEAPSPRTAEQVPTGAVFWQGRPGIPAP